MTQFFSRICVQECACMCACTMWVLLSYSTAGMEPMTTGSRDQLSSQLSQRWISPRRLRQKIKTGLYTADIPHCIHFIFGWVTVYHPCFILIMILSLYTMYTVPIQQPIPNKGGIIKHKLSWWCMSNDHDDWWLVWMGSCPETVIDEKQF